ncbi:hypothetical protein H632_c1010p0 [Helicosporidium sp. ATCC 50920]|nr:hypothetical protein H632_c1010p0 [Helicosporidium sp. ATCC 50920]|eukprot:KDD74885.1 hypothetical protein H632_c1010p0 [Helicosporidium sp. ATCC 50920]
MALQRVARALSSREARLAQTSFSHCRVFSSSAFSPTSIHIEEEVYNRQRNLMPLGNRVPTTAPDAWVAPSAVVVGDVDLFDRVSVWYGAVLRGDLNSIRVGAFSNIQDRTVVHAAAATVESEAVVGDRCVLLEGSLVEKHSVLAPGSVLPPGRRVPSGELWAGAPARKVRKLNKDEIVEIPKLAASISALAQTHAGEFLPHSFAYVEAESLRSILKPGAALAEAADLGSADRE